MLMKLALGLFHELPGTSWVQPPAEQDELDALSGLSLLPSPASLWSWGISTGRGASRTPWLLTFWKAAGSFSLCSTTCSFK